MADVYEDGFDRDNQFYPYPDPTVDPRKKGYDWILQFARAAWSDGRGSIPSTMLYYGRSRLEEIKEYSMGKQSINKYKKILLGDEQENQSWLGIDWTVPSFLTKFREIAITKLMQREYDIQAFAVDPLSKSEEDAQFNEMKLKVMMRDIAAKQGSELAQSPLLKANPGDPENAEELKMKMDFGYKHEMCIEVEEAVQLVMQQNNIADKRRRTIEYLFDFGVGGYTTFINYNGTVGFEEVNAENMITSFCLKDDFSDWSHFGNIKFASLTDIKPYFTPTQLDEIAKKAAGKWNNPAFPPEGMNLKYYDRFKVMVLDLQFFTVNTTVYENEVDGRDNTRFNKTDYEKLKFITNNNTTDMGEQWDKPNDIPDPNSSEPRFIKSDRKVVYQTKWIVGTEYMYDYGLAPNTLCQPSTWWDRRLDTDIRAWNFYKMMFTGITERLIPIQDEICLDWYSLQNIRNKMIPYVMNIDWNALESIPFGKGGKVMEKHEILEFLMQNFIMPYRSNDLMTGNPNYKPVTIEATPSLGIIAEYVKKIQMNIQLMQTIIGFNELTDGSTPNPKMLVPGIESAIQSTNNALGLIANADKQLINRLAEQIMGKVQIAVKTGKVQGYLKSLGTNTIKFLDINPDISIREFGIFVDNYPEDSERQMLLQQLNIKESNGLISPEDYIIVMNCRNLKQAAQYLAYAVKKRSQEAQQNQIQQQQAIAQANGQSAIQLELEKRKTLELDIQGRIQVAATQGQWTYQTEAMKKQSDQTEAQIQSQARIISSHIQAEAKKAVQNVNVAI